MTFSRRMVAWLRAGARSVEAAAIAGVVYAILAIAALILLNASPPLSLDDAQMAAWFDASDNRSGLILGLNFAAISSIAFLWFVAVIRRRIGDSEDQFFSTVFLGSAIAYVAVWLIGAAAIAAPAAAVELLDAAVIDTSLATLAQGEGAAVLLVVAPRLQAVFVLTSTTIVRRTGALAQWFVVVGYLFGIALLVTPMVSRPIGVAFPIWVFVASVALFATRTSEPGPDEEEPGDTSIPTPTTATDSTAPGAPPDR